MKTTINLTKVLALILIAYVLVKLIIWSCSNVLHDNKGPGALFPVITIGLGYGVSYLLLLPAYTVILWSRSWTPTIITIFSLLLIALAILSSLYLDEYGVGGLFSIFFGLASDVQYKIVLLKIVFVTLIITPVTTLARKLFIKYTSIKNVNY